MSNTYALGYYSSFLRCALEKVVRTLTFAHWLTECPCVSNLIGTHWNGRSLLVAKLQRLERMDGLDPRVADNLEEHSRISTTSNSDEDFRVENRGKDGYRTIANGYIYKCHICYKRFRGRVNLIGHKNQVHGTKSHSCNYCSYRSSSTTNVKSHTIRLHLNDRGTQFQCSQCGARCFNKSYLQRHIRQVHNTACKKARPGKSRPVSLNHLPFGVNNKGIRSRKKQRCPYCPQRGFVSNIQRHIKLTHTNRVEYRCPHCTASYRALRHFKAHLELHEDENKELGSMEDKSVSVIKDNVKIKNIRHKCPECPLEANSLYDVRKHYDMVHKIQQPYQCPHCTASYQAIAKYRFHLKLHEGRNRPSLPMKPPRPVRTEAKKASVRIQEALEDENFMDSKTEEHSSTSSSGDKLNEPSAHLPMLDEDFENYRSCTVCGICFGSRADLLRHRSARYHSYNTNISAMRGNGGEGEPSYKIPPPCTMECKVCHMVFPFNVFESHMRKHGFGAKTKRFRSKSSFPSNEAPNFEENNVTNAEEETMQSSGSISKDSELIEGKEDG